MADMGDVRSYNGPPRRCDSCAVDAARFVVDRDGGKDLYVCKAHVKDAMRVEAARARREHRLVHGRYG